MEPRRTDQLEAALARFSHLPELVGGIRRALGDDTGTTPLDPARFPVVAFLLQPRDDVFAAYLLTPGRFIVHERTPDGDTLLVAVPISRVARVAESDIAGELTVTVELDADVRTTTTTDVDERSSQGVTAPAAYAIAAPDPGDRPALFAFAAALRRALGS